MRVGRRGRSCQLKGMKEHWRPSSFTDDKTCRRTTLEKEREALRMGAPSEEPSPTKSACFRSRAIDLRRVMSISSTMSPTALRPLAQLQCFGFSLYCGFTG